MLILVICRMSRFKRVNITLPMEWYEWLNKEVESGIFASRSEIIRQALMIYREELYKLKTLEKL